MIASLRRLILDFWQPVIIFILALAIITWLSLYKIQTLVPGLSFPEITSLNQSQSLHIIINNPTNVPFKLYELLLIHYKVHSDLFIRLFGLTVGALTGLFFFLILRMRYNKYVAFFSTGLFVSSSWYLHIARIATPDVLLFGIVGLIWAFLMLYRTTHDRIAVTVIAILCGGLLYVPGIIWFMIAAAVWQRKFLYRMIENLPIWLRFITVIVTSIVVSPLIWSISHGPKQALQLSGLPTKLFTPIQYAHRLVDIPLNLFIRGPLDPVEWLGRLPILDIFSTVMVILGLYCYWQQRKLEFPRLVIGSIVIGSLLITIGGSVTISIIIPLVYFIISAGIAELLSQWLSVFPRNPLARGVGVAILTIAIVLSGYYQLQRYFVAWPNSPITKTFFSGTVD